ncbi:carboxypeptidase-like regulatory domain-containing protein [Pedobacter nototheniae]|uniref:carboxypeptidase-like regulatory domain-containing protein n=1 Tax=Pedobacter nototheniae TaxID=2488994 RepID=UPI00292E1E29|nr:carboxypeptidase-like regulatory domain-containing protein [Pedobacter nototheniae]
MCLKKSLFFLLFNLLYVSLVFSQDYIHGKITDSLSKPIAFANIALLNNGIIIKYTQSNQEGQYAFKQQEKSTVQYLQLQFTSVGFEKKIVAITTAQKQYNVMLKASSLILSEILVKSKPAPIQKRGDTTNFDLSFYKAPQDRVIEDVLKKIPGIEITEAGKISYNGKSITSFFIDGDNLLDDKYTLGTKTIPAGIVDTLQVFENHQPIKALNKISPSDNVSLNIVLNPKARIKVTGLANLGLGTNEHFKEETNLMSLKKGYKTLNLIKYNSDGYDLSKEITAQNFTEKNADLGRNTNYPLINLNTVVTPNLSQNKYLFNHAFLATSNQLFKLSNDIQLKLSGHYFRDAQKSTFSRLTQQVILTDTIRYLEEQNQQDNPHRFELRGDLTINKKKYYFNNTLVFKNETLSTNALITVNSNLVNQVLKVNPYEFYNEAKYIKTIQNDKALEFFSFISKSNQNQNLNIFPSVFNGYEVQQIKTPQLFVNNGLALKVLSGKIFQEFKVSHTYDEKEINSAINGIYSNQLGNNLKWKYNKLQFSPSFSYADEKIKILLSLPVSYNGFSFNDNLYESNHHENKFAFEPKLTFKINQGKENRVTAQYQYKNDFGDANTQYQGYILSNYRTLNAYSTDFLSQSNTHNFSMGYNFSKSISLFSFNVFGLYSVKENNSISQINFNNFNQTTLQLPLINYNRNLLLIGNTNKYIFELKTTVKANFALQQLYSNQVLNAQLLPYKTIAYTYGFGTDTKFNNWVYLKYAASYVPTRSKTTAFNLEAQKNTFINQKMELVLLPVKPVIFKVNVEHQFYKSTSSNASNYLFLDANLNWKFAKARQELTFSAINLANIKSYRTNYLSAYTSANSSYQLLGRFFQANYIFNF